MLPFTFFTSRLGASLLLFCGLLSACHPSSRSAAPPPPPPVPRASTAPPSRQSSQVNELLDTLAYARQGFYFRFSGDDDTASLFRQLPLVQPLPGYRVSYVRPQLPDSLLDQPLPRQFRLADLRVTMYHHESLWLQDDAHDHDTWLRCHPELFINAWEYQQSVLEFPQLRTGAGPLTQLNRKLQARYELHGPDNSESVRWQTSEKPGTLILPFGLSAAQLARRPFYQRVDSSAADNDRLRWEADYCLLDTSRVYERFPYNASLTVLGGTHRLLGLLDYHRDDAERFPDPTDAAEAWAAQSPAYYSLRLARRVNYSDLFRPALAAAVWQAARPLLRQVRQHRHQPPLTPTQWRELAQPRYWAFSSRGWYAVYLADAYQHESEMGDDYQRYRLDVEVFIPYARLRAYLRP